MVKLDAGIENSTVKSRLHFSCSLSTVKKLKTDVLISGVDNHLSRTLLTLYILHLSATGTDITAIL